MEIASFAQDQRDRFPPRALSDISIASSSSPKVHQHSIMKSGSNAHGRRIKLMCSFGGRILPRPSDRRLRYVGGETRMVSVSRNVHYEAFLGKLMEIYGPDLAVKYQLPDEDLDALVSVTSDEDLENMMDECMRLEALEGASRLRVFVFTARDMLLHDVNSIADSTMSELRYVDAVNAVPVEPSFKKSSDSSNSLGQVAYGWSASHRPSLLQESFQPSSGAPSFYASKADDIAGFGSPSHPISTARQHTAPLEFISIQPADKSGYYGHGAVADDFRDLESGGSASSSTSSQQDPYNRHQWASRSQKQLHLETSAYAPQFQDSVAKATPEGLRRQTEQLNTRNVSKNQGSQDAGLNHSAISVTPLECLPDELIQLFDMQSTDRERELAMNLHGDRALSPGARLHKQLEAHRDSSEPKETENKASSILHTDDMELPILSQGLEHTIPSGKSLNPDRFIPDFLRTQAFEPLNNRQLVEAPSDQAQSTIGAEQLDNAQQSALMLEESMRLAFSKDNTVGFPFTNYPGGLYNEDDRERTDLSIFASQPFPKEAYNTVFQTCSTEIPLPSLSEADELLQQVLNSDVSFADQTSSNAYHNEITSQAPWPSPDPSTFPIYREGTNSASEMPSDDFSQADPIGMPRTQNFGAVQGGPTQMSGRYVQGGEPYSMSLNPTPAQTDLPEKHSIAENGSLALPASFSTDSARTESPVGSHLSSLGCLEETNDKDNETAFSYAATGLMELSIDDSRDTQIGMYQGPQSSNESILQQGNPSDVENKSIEAKEDTESSTLGTIASSSQAAPSFLELWRGGTAQAEHESPSTSQLNFKQQKDIKEMGSGNAMEKDMTIDEQKSVIEEFEIFQSAADKSMNSASAAEVEAIARGLQIIRHSDLEELRELGSGTFGTVYHGKWRGTDVAIKRIKSSCFMGRPPERERLIADFWREACILGQLHHPNVVAFYGVVPDGPGGTLATVTEYMVNGSLKQALQKKDRTLDRRKRLLIAMDVAFGMEYLHGKNVVHFDIKCENLLVNLRDLQRPICKVGDLGLSKVKQQTMVSGGVRGTLPWMAPELLNGSSSLVSEKVDVFSFGIVLWELLTGEEPYASMHYGAIIGGIVSNTLRPPVPRWCDSTYRSLMERCWSADPSERPTFSDIARTLRGMEAALSVKVQGQTPSSGTVVKEKSEHVK